MFKAFIKYVFYKVYQIGYFEAKRRDFKKQIAELKGKVSFIDEFSIKEAKIFYNQSEKNKIRIGNDTLIKGELLIFRHGGEISIGNYSLVGTDSRVWSSKKISIGDRVLISHNVNIHDNVSHPLDSKERHEDYKHIQKTGLQENIKINEAEIVIEDDVWIGFNSTVLKGVRIGKGSIIGANTVVTKDIPPFSIVIGNPQRIIGQSK